MTSPQGEPDKLTISRQEVFSSHVDDLLARQKNLRGERDVARGRGAWYYQNWFVLMLVGGLAAFAAWGLLEPSYSDEIRFQGVIDSVDMESRLPSFVETGDSTWLTFRHASAGSVLMNGQLIWLFENSTFKAPDGSWQHLRPSSLYKGERVAMYVQYRQFPGSDLAMAFHVDTTVGQGIRPTTASLASLNARSNAAGLLLFAVVGGFIGLAIGAADGVICRVPRRAIIAGLVGLAVGFLGGFISGVLANLVYAPIHRLSMAQMTAAGTFSPGAFGLQMLGRSFAWACAGMTMGLGQGIALRSLRLLLWGLIGGVVGALLGGLLFDPVDQLLLNNSGPSAWVSRLIGIVAIGLGVGAMIGVVERLARDAWLRMIEGPLAGKEFMIFKDRMALGSSPRSEIYLFNDPLVAEHHANLRSLGDETELEVADSRLRVEVNGRPIDRVRLRQGDRITLGRTSFVFETRGS
jgi:hypothetical protein